MPTIISPEIAQNRLNDYIQTGLLKGAAAIDEMRDEYENRNDFLAHPATLLMEPSRTRTDKRIQITNTKTLDTYQTTEFAHQQTLKRLNFPGRYYDYLTTLPESEKGVALAAYNLHSLAQMYEGRFLLREVRGVVKGVLSDSYRRIDTSPVFMQYRQAAEAAGMVMTYGQVTDTRNQLRYIMPTLFEPVPNEFLVYGTEMVSSDYGRGALAMAFFAMRVVCNNGMIGIDMLRKVHLGKRFEDTAQLSDRTHELDAETVGSAARDLIAGTKFQDEIKRTNALIADGASEIDAGAVLSRWQKKQRITKPEMEKALTLYNEVDAIEQLPPMKGTWRLSNTISLMANNATGDKAIDLQEVASEILSATR